MSNRLAFARLLHRIGPALGWLTLVLTVVGAVLLWWDGQSFAISAWGAVVDVLLLMMWREVKVPDGIRRKSRE